MRQSTPTRERARANLYILTNAGAGTPPARGEAGIHGRKQQYVDGNINANPPLLRRRSIRATNNLAGLNTEANFHTSATHPTLPLQHLPPHHRRTTPAFICSPIQSPHASGRGGGLICLVFRHALNLHDFRPATDALSLSLAPRFCLIRALSFPELF